jgi:hypothetical protein
MIGMRSVSPLLSVTTITLDSWPSLCGVTVMSNVAGVKSCESDPIAIAVFGLSSWGCPLMVTCVGALALSNWIVRVAAAPMRISPRFSAVGLENSGSVLPSQFAVTVCGNVLTVSLDWALTVVVY